MMKRKIHTVHVIVDGKIDNYIVFHHSHSESALQLQGGEEEEFNLDHVKHEPNDSLEMFLKQTSKRMNDPISLSSIFLGDAQYQTLFWNSDDEILSAAVDTLGFSNWECISQIWFENKKTDDQCFKRSIELKLKSKNHRKIISYDNNSKNIINLESKVEVDSKMSNKKSHRQLEALETRRLFGKERNEWELNIINQAYIVGKSNLKTILEMNCVSDAMAVGKETSISFSSLAVLMKELPRPEWLADTTSVIHYFSPLKKPPKSIEELEDSKVLSPIWVLEEDMFFHDAGNSSNISPSPALFDNPFQSNIMMESVRQSESTAAPEQEPNDNLHYVLNLKSTYFQDILENSLKDEINSITPMKRSHEEYMLNAADENAKLEHFNSPPLQNSFLPITLSPAPPVKQIRPRPKQFFFIR